MDGRRINKKVYQYFNNKSGVKCKNWQYEIKCFSDKLNLNNFFENCHSMSNKLFVKKVAEKNMECFVNEWKQPFNAENGRNGIGRNKLRTYRLFKQDFKTEIYVDYVHSKQT